MMLNYDLTFLAILHTGLYEPETEKERKRCILHPVRRHDSVQNEAVAYAADMCVLLSYQKLLDDWRDDRKYPQRAAAGVLKKSYKRLEEQYPRQAEAIEKNIRLLSQAEQEKAVDIDYVSGLTGKFLKRFSSGRRTSGKQTCAGWDFSWASLSIFWMPLRMWRRTGRKRIIICFPNGEISGRKSGKGTAGNAHLYDGRGFPEL